MLKKLKQEPLIHFLLLGGFIFLLYSFLNPAAERMDKQIIHFDEGDMNKIISNYQRNWQEQPDTATLKKLLQSEIRKEIFYREALRLNLDHNDEIIKRRLEQKYEFLMKDLLDVETPKLEDLKKFHQTHPDLYQSPKKISFQHIYFSPDIRKTAEVAAIRFLKKIKKETPQTIDFKAESDPFHLSHNYNNREESAIAQVFGQDFSRAVFRATTVGWLAPVTSGFGQHLVYVSAIETEHILPFEQVQTKVIEDYKNIEMVKYHDLLFKNLQEQYQIKGLESWGIE